jgi:hypothetical protein
LRFGVISTINDKLSPILFQILDIDEIIKLFFSTIIFCIIEIIRNISNFPDIRGQNALFLTDITLLIYISIAAVILFVIIAFRIIIWYINTNSSNYLIRYFRKVVDIIFIYNIIIYVLVLFIFFIVQESIKIIYNFKYFRFRKRISGKVNLKYFCEIF